MGDKVIKSDSWNFGSGFGHCRLTYSKVYEAMVEIGLDKMNGMVLWCSKEQLGYMMWPRQESNADVMAASLFYNGKFKLFDERLSPLFVIKDKFDGEPREITRCYVENGDERVYIECLRLYSDF